MTALCTAENVSQTRISVNGVPIEPDRSAEVAPTNSVSELEAHGALRLTRKPKPKRGRTPRRPPVGEE